MLYAVPYPFRLFSLSYLFLSSCFRRSLFVVPTNSIFLLCFLPISFRVGIENDRHLVTRRLIRVVIIIAVSVDMV